MMDAIKMTKVIGGKRYSTKTATLVADDVYWDGHNMEHGGRNSWLYRTPLGAWFAVHGTFWQGEQDTLEPLSEAEAQELFEGSLTEHYMKWSEAFQREPEEPVGERGRPPMYESGKMIQTAIWLPGEMLEWLKAQPGTASEVVRGMIEGRMKAEAVHE
jgi:hypothetical protein